MKQKFYIVFHGQATCLEAQNIIIQNTREKINKKRSHN